MSCHSSVTFHLSPGKQGPAAHAIEFAASVDVVQWSAAIIGVPTSKIKIKIKIQCDKETEPSVIRVEEPHAGAPPGSGAANALTR